MILAQEVNKFSGDKVVIETFGSDGKWVGNHAIVSYTHGNHSMILDGTTATVGFGDIDDVLSERLLSTYNIFDFYVDTDDAVEILKRKMRGAPRVGALRPKTIIYRDRC